MFNEVQGLIQRVTTGEIDQPSVSQAASDHVSSMDHSDLVDTLQSAADNANQNGEGGFAQQIIGLVEQYSSNPQGLKEAAVSLITNNPQILQQFEPDFAKGILSRI